MAAALALAACGGSTTGPNNGNPDAAQGSGTPDAAPASGDLTPPPAGQGFQLKSPEITLAAGEEATYCWYTTIPLSAATGIKKWESKMTAGSHHLIVFFTTSASQPDGTLSKGCGLLGGGGGGFPIWTYSAQTPDNSAQMPDGVGMAVDAQQHLYVQLHYLNTGDTELKAHATINGWTFDAGTQFMKAYAFVSYNTKIHIPGGVGMQASAKATCANVPTGVNFFAMSTHSHRRSVHTQVFDGTTKILDSTDWEHPTTNSWQSTTGWDFYKFSGSLTYQCDYVNDLTTDVNTGDSAATNEMCMAVGYFFPATAPVFCIN